MNDLIINTRKTGAMLFHNKQINVPVKPRATLNNSNLDYKMETKFLGIHIMETLKWNSHIQSLASKLSKVSFMIKSVRETLSPNLISNIYFAKFQSLLCSGIQFWGGDRGRIKCEIIQNSKKGSEINSWNKLKNIL